ncbi:lipopolysaccharide-binding protein-like, partial [Python bivittatus]|uniref:Bactericidal permeability-increasing protein n=1 Tax=Python bivittatus TaxID=176946 RepID=A0A9F2WJG5_PYTBI
MSKASLLLLWLCCLVPSPQGINPGFVGRISKKGLDYARQQGVAALQETLATITLPEFSGSFRVKVIGKVNYKFYSLNIRKFELFHSVIESVPGKGLRVSISNAAAELTGRWEVKKRWFKDHGSFDLKVEGISISVDLKLDSDATGRLAVTTLDCSTRISSVDIHISGSLDWLYNLFHNAIESAFRRAMEDKVCEIVRSSVSSRLQPYLQSLPVTASIDRTASIDYSLVGPPVATSDCVDLDLKGEFFSTTHRSPAPFPPPALALPVDHDRMIYFGISTYFFNTAGNVYYRAESLTFWVTDNMVPKEFKIRLNTTSFEPFIPQ